jgi:tetratricopeptide (TPR) repeat protein
MPRFRVPFFRVLRTVALAACALAPATAFADDDEAALEKGKKLYDEAVVLLEAKKFVEACPKLEQAVKLVPVAVGARLALAECEEGRGKLATALAAFRKSQSLAATAGQADREKHAAAEVARVAARVGTVRIAIAPADASLGGLAVELDGRAVEQAERAAPIAVDAGKRVVRVSASGRTPFVQEVDAADGREVVVTVTLAAESSGQGKPGSSGGASPLFIVGIAAGAAGVAALAAGGGVGGLAIAKNGESYELGCIKGQGCPAGDATNARQSAYDAAAASTALFIAGGVLAAAGVALVIAAPSRSAKPAVTGVALRLGPGGFALEGAFR